MYCKFKHPGESLAATARRKEVNDVFRVLEVLTVLVYVAMCEHFFGWQSALDEDIYRFHMPTFYGVVATNTPIDATIVLSLHGVLISHFLFDVQTFFGYLQHCVMLLS